MFGSRLRFSASSLAARILRCLCSFATILGVVTFRVDGNRYDGRLVAIKKRYYFSWFCMLLRIAILYLYYSTYSIFVNIMQVSHLRILIMVRIACIIFCTLAILVMQFWYEDQVIELVNGFLRLFRRVNSLPGCELMCFGGQRELILLICAVLCQVYQIFYMIPALIDDFTFEMTMTLLFETYCGVCAALIGHICFVGYLSMGALYDQVNVYIQHAFRDQLTDLKATNSRRQLKEAVHCLNECLAIYDEIQRIASEFQRLFDVPLCLVLLFGFLTMALCAFFIVLNQFEGSALWFFQLKMLTDLLLVTVAIEQASNNSQIIRRLSLENYYVTECSDWHQKLEMFFSRLNYQEFRVCPLGLFDVSNSLILVFLSALVTYLTYVIQYDMQSQLF